MARTIRATHSARSARMHRLDVVPRLWKGMVPAAARECCGGRHWPPRTTPGQCIKGRALRSRAHHNVKDDIIDNKGHIVV